jgi:hypothetical protein
MSLVDDNLPHTSSWSWNVPSRWRYCLAIQMIIPFVFLELGNALWMCIPPCSRSKRASRLAGRWITAGDRVRMRSTAVKGLTRANGGSYSTRSALLGVDNISCRHGGVWDHRHIWSRLLTTPVRISRLSRNSIARRARGSGWRSR